MPRLSKSISFETTFGTYIVDELIGEGAGGAALAFPGGRPFASFEGSGFWLLLGVIPPP